MAWRSRTPKSDNPEAEELLERDEYPREEVRETNMRARPITRPEEPRDIREPRRRIERQPSGVPLTREQREQKFERKGENTKNTFDDIIAKLSKPKDGWVGGDGTNRRPTTDTQPRRKIPISEFLEKKRAAAKDGVTLSVPGKRVPVKGHFGKLRMFKGHERPITWVELANAGATLYTASKDGKVFAWNVEEGEQERTFSGHNGAVFSLSVRYCNTRLVTVGADQAVFVWDCATGTKLCSAENYGLLKTVEWSACGTQIVACSRGFGKRPPTIYIWNYSEAKDTCSLSECLAICDLPAKPTQVRFGPGTMLISSHDDGSLCVWQSHTGHLMKRVHHHTDTLTKFGFNADRTEVITASLDKHARIYKLPDLQLVRTIVTDRPLNSAAFLVSQDVRMCLLGGGLDAREVALVSNAKAQFETLIYPCDRPCKEPLDMIAGPFGPVHIYAVGMEPFGFVSGAEDGCVRVHNFEEAYLKRTILAALTIETT